MRPPLELLLSFLGLVAGLLLAFAGYRLAKTLAAFAGFLAGFVIGLAVGAFAGIVGSLVAALVLGVLFALLFTLGFRLVGAALGGSAAFGLAQTLGWPTWGIVLAVVAGIVIGLLANKVMIVLATALSGASLAVRSAVELMGDAGMAGPGGEDAFLLWGAIAVAAMGALVQWRQVRQEG